MKNSESALVLCAAQAFACDIFGHVCAFGNGSASSGLLRAAVKTKNKYTTPLKANEMLGFSKPKIYRSV